MRRTKIVCTLGPATDSERVLCALIRAGMDVARLNFSHGTLADHARRIRAVHSAARELGKPVAILQDLCGPRLRLGAFRAGEATVRDRAEFVITTQPVQGDESRAQVQLPELPGFLSRGDRVLLADGAIEFRVVRASRDEILCRVVKGGLLRSHQGMNLPDTALPIPAFTKKDRTDLVFGIRRGVDWVAMSFVSKAADIEPARALLRKQRSRALLIAKIEKKEAVQNLEEIVDASDGVMVARGDLGVEVALDQVPVLQKRMIRLCNQAGKPVITATQMLETMITNPRPTRAEVSDVANAVLDGTDAVMLSGETAVGRYPVAAVRIMARTAARAETDLDFEAIRRAHAASRCADPTESAAEAACMIAHDLRASAIVCNTSSGFTARMVSKHRPDTRIIAVTPSDQTLRRIALFWGVCPVLVPRSRNTDEMLRRAITGAVQSGAVQRGDLVIITAGVPIGIPGHTNLIKIAKVP